MARSKRTQAQIQDKEAQKYDYVGDEKVASHLHEVELAPSTLETIDGAVLNFINEELNLSVESNEGFKKVPVLIICKEMGTECEGKHIISIFILKKNSET